MNETYHIRSARKNSLTIKMFINGDTINNHITRSTCRTPTRQVGHLGSSRAAAAPSRTPSQQPQHRTRCMHGTVTTSLTSSTRQIEHCEGLSVLLALLSMRRLVVRGFDYSAI